MVVRPGQAMVMSVVRMDVLPQQNGCEGRSLVLQHGCTHRHGTYLQHHTAVFSGYCLGTNALIRSFASMLHAHRQAPTHVRSHILTLT